VQDAPLPGMEYGEVKNFFFKKAFEKKLQVKSDTTKTTFQKWTFRQSLRFYLSPIFEKCTKNELIALELK
jgi:hypothetical protein